MAYCTLDDLRNAAPEQDFIDLTDFEGAGLASEPRMQAAIDDAEAEINGYLGTRYKLPLAQVPSLLKGACVDVALYLLYSRRQPEPPEAVRTRYEDRMKFMKDVAAGKATLGISEEPDAPASTTGAEARMGKQKFTRESMEGF